MVMETVKNLVSCFVGNRGSLEIEGAGLKCAGALFSTDPSTPTQ